MNEDFVKEMEHIKRELSEGTYSILQKPQWDKFAQDLSNCGNKILKKIEEIRTEARKIKITLFTRRRRLEDVIAKYEGVAKEFDLFFDSGMRWLHSIIDGNKYEEYQILRKKHIEGLLEHCRQAMDYLGNIISSKRDEHRFYRSLVWSVIAVTVALIFGIYSVFK